MIPSNIRKTHIISATKEIDSKGVPAGRESKKFLLVFEGKKYPPKYVLALANKFADGRLLDSDKFSGGLETNNFLKKLGFQIEEIGPLRKTRRKISRLAVEKKVHCHNERCEKCKDTIENLLRKIYGKVKRNYRFEVSSGTDAYNDSLFYNNLKTIFELLQGYRGYKNFVRTRGLPHCDFFVPKPGLIVEFDESQHFTFPRKISLSHYPETLRLGFSVRRWINICEKINSKDSDPPFRDEQRSWYDTLRDFLPEIIGLNPTVRLYANDMQWCGLDPGKHDDVLKFKKLIEGAKMKLKSWIATVVLQSNGKYSNPKRLQVLSDVVREVAAKTQGDGVILFPGGWFTAEERKARTLYEWVGSRVSDILIKISDRNLVACVGIDGRETTEWAKDQIGAAVTKNGIIALGRKFHPTQKEKKYIEPAEDYMSKEENKSRIFGVAGRKFFICACYDSFGIKHLNLPNPGVDVILDLIHQFNPPGEANSGNAYFARHGLAGASNQWKCPTFAGVVFFGREIPRNWPSAVYWDGGNTKYCTYQSIAIKTIEEIYLKVNEGSILIRVFDLDGLS